MVSPTSAHHEQLTFELQPAQAHFTIFDLQQKLGRKQNNNQKKKKESHSKQHLQQTEQTKVQRNGDKHHTKKVEEE